jgi:hypothetical protein
LTHLDPHHVVKRSQGGLDTATNIVCLCRPCHEHTDLAEDNENWLGVEATAPGRDCIFIFSKWIHNRDVDFPRQTTYIRYRRIWA